MSNAAANSSSSPDDADVAGELARARYRRNQIGCFMLLFLVMIFLLNIYQEDATYLSSNEEKVEHKIPSGHSHSKPNSELPEQDDFVEDDGSVEDNSKSSKVRDDFWYSPTKVVKELQSNLNEAKERLNVMLEKDYGEYASIVFKKDAIFSVMHTETTEKIKRKLQLKIIEAQLRYLGEMGNSEGEDMTNVTFRWYTGGHSAAAGHGNLFHQNSFVKLGETAMDIFASVGIDFIAENRAMGAYRSGYETAMCMDAIFGRDIDAISWDYGMTDGRDPRNYWLWTARAGMAPTMPVVFLMDMRKGEVNAEIQKAGMAAVQVHDLMTLRRMFPNTDEIENVDALPPGVKYFMCKGHSESEQPCRDHRFDTDICSQKPKYQVSWHNGWKDHMFIGRVLGTFWAELLIEAVSDLAGNGTSTISPSPAISIEYYEHLRSIEESDRKLFLNSPPTLAEQYEILAEGLFPSFMRGEIYCHTALLPSTARYQGLTDGSLKKAVHHFGGYYTDFNFWTPSTSLSQPDPDSDEKGLILTYDPGRRQKVCPEIKMELENDYKDWFSVLGGDGWVSATLPNTAELDAYNLKDTSKRKGSVLICTRFCEFDKCGGDFIFVEEIFRNETVSPNLEIRIDDQEVESATKVDTNCYLLMGKDRSLTWGRGKIGSEGQYKFEFKVNKAGYKLYLSSIIVT